MKKKKIFFIIFALIALISTISSATYDTVTMTLLEKPTATIQFSSKSYAERSVIAEDMKNKEITLQLKVVNGETSVKPTGELILVIDNSKSMESTVANSTTTREQLVINSANQLVKNLLTNNEQLKIGVVSFSTESSNSEATEKDAQLVSDLTNDANALTTAISNIQYTGPRTDLQAGLNLTKKYFTSDTDSNHKYIVVLTDGLPNVAIGDNKAYFSDSIMNTTKEELKSLSSITNNVYIMLTGVTEGDKTIETNPTKTYNQYLQEIFGTEENPTIGKFYNISDDKIEETITKEIYEDLAPVEKTLKNIKVSDYFTDEIINNFDFSYVKDPNIGTISPKIDTSSKSITWTIPELKSGETAIVQYKLKLKKNYSEDIVNKVLNTNTKLDVTYTDPTTNKEDTKSSTITPKLKLTEPAAPAPVKEEPKEIPKTGSPVVYGVILTAVAIAAVIGIRYEVIKNSMKQ